MTRRLCIAAVVGAVPIVASWVLIFSGHVLAGGYVGSAGGAVVVAGMAWAKKA